MASKRESNIIWVKRLDYVLASLTNSTANTQMFFLQNFNFIYSNFKFFFLNKLQFREKELFIECIEYIADSQV